METLQSATEPATIISGDRELEGVVARVRAEFLEMPGMCLTEAQARRLFDLDRPTCRHVMNRLVQTRFLVWRPRDQGGVLIRSSVDV